MGETIRLNTCFAIFREIDIIHYNVYSFNYVLRAMLLESTSILLLKLIFFRFVHGQAILISNSINNT